MSYFEPLDQTAHEMANKGADIDDICRNCQHDFLDHTNGYCPVMSFEERMAAKRSKEIHLVEEEG